MSEHSNICYYCDGQSNDSNISLMECNNNYHRGGRSWTKCYKIKSKSEDISRIIKFYENQDPI